MARPSYLARRGDGRYFLQIRLGKRTARLFGIPLLRVSLRTADFGEARRRLVGNLGWVQELIAAPDLEALGTMLDARLHAYVDRGTPADERVLTERCAFEHEVRRYLARAQERGYAYQVRLPKMPTRWVDFVNQNKAAENNIARLAVRRSYESGRVEATEAANECWTAPAAPTRSQEQTFDPIAIIDRLIQDAVAQRLPQVRSPQVGTIALPSAAAAPQPPEAVADNTSRHMSEVLADFLKPLDRKRRHTAKGRGEAEPVVQSPSICLATPA